MNGKLIFTHIPKTAGTSLKKSVILPNVRPDRVYWMQGVKKLLRDRPVGVSVVLGHVPYGIHPLLGRGPFHYMTILRDPVDRAVSFYNYVLMCETRNPGHPGRYRGHPALPDAKRYPIDEFYALEKYRNVQTKFTAGILWERGRTFKPDGVRDLVLSERRMLCVAERNLLERYWFFGLLERIEDAQERISRELGWVNETVRDTSRQTSGRQEWTEPTPAQRDRIRELNALDEALYSLARDRYDRQTVGRRPESG